MLVRSSLSLMHEAIGRAVGAAQMFETVIVVCAEFLRFSKESLAGKETSAFVNTKRLKTATKALLKELSQSNDIAPDFEERVVRLVDKRHILIHRWYAENGWPDEDDVDDINRLAALAKEVEGESREIVRMLAQYILSADAAARGDTDSGDVRHSLARIFKNVTRRETIGEEEHPSNSATD